MDITIERTLAQQFSLEINYWNRKTMRLKIGLPIVAICGIFGIIKSYIFNSANALHSDFSIIIYTVFSTFALTLIWLIYFNKSNNFKPSKERLAKNIPYPTTVKLSDYNLSTINPEKTIIFSWEYFKNYYIKENTLHIIKNKIDLSIIISLSELTVTEQSELVDLFGKKGIKRILP